MRIAWLWDAEGEGHLQDWLGDAVIKLPGIASAEWHPAALDPSDERYFVSSLQKLSVLRVLRGCRWPTK